MDVNDMVIRPSGTPGRRMGFEYKIDCPVTVLTPGRGRKRTIARGWLYDIGERGARIHLNEPLDLQSRVTLDVHLPNPDSRITTIRFKCLVTGVCCGPPYELALSFLGKEDFVRGKIAEFRQGSQLVSAKGSDKWVN